MPDIRQSLNRRLSPREVVLVICALAVLAGLGYASYRYIAAKVLEARVNAACPTLCAAVRDQRTELVKAIEAYKTKFGVYPPDHALSLKPLVVDPVTNTLLYELVGVIYDPASKTYSVGGLEPATADYVKDYFQIKGFRNCAETTNGIERFLTLDPLPSRQVHDDPDVFALGFQPSFDVLPPEVFWEFDVSPWRYVSSAPTNNPGKFDLWTELGTRDRKVVIGNWRTVE